MSIFYVKIIKIRWRNWRSYPQTLGYVCAKLRKYLRVVNSDCTHCMPPPPPPPPPLPNPGCATEQKEWT